MATAKQELTADLLGLLDYLTELDTTAEYQHATRAWQTRCANYLTKQIEKLENNQTKKKKTTNTYI